MAKRRTKKQKKKTLRKRSVSGVGYEAKKKERVVDYGYSPKLIKKDLIKTVLISLLILAVELGLYFFVFK